MKKIYSLFIGLLIISSTGFARPQYSILQSFGTKCTSCHINTQGGGIRNNPGFLSRNAISLVEVGKAGDLINKTSNILDEKLNINFGFDFRLQSARWKATSPTKVKVIDDTDTSEFTENLLETARDQMLMQFTPYLAWRPAGWLELEGQYNFAYEIENKKRYPGQQPFTASAIFKLGEGGPLIRIGQFQPTIGTKFDDHTLLIRKYVDNNENSRPLIPVDYAEFGAQIDYEKLEWLGVSLGVFSAKNMANLTLSNSKPVASSDAPSVVARLSFYPNTKSYNTFFGGYWLFNKGNSINKDGQFDDYYYIGDLYWHIGMADKFAVIAEYVRSYKHKLRSTNNFLLEVNYQVSDPINVFVRAERGNTEDNIKGEVFHHNQMVLGTHIFPLPFFDLLVEYRIYDREYYSDVATQWALQMHIFY